MYTSDIRFIAKKTNQPNYIKIIFIITITLYSDFINISRELEIQFWFYPL